VDSSWHGVCTRPRRQSELRCRPTKSLRALARLLFERRNSLKVSGGLVPWQLHPGQAPLGGVPEETREEASDRPLGWERAGERVESGVASASAGDALCGLVKGGRDEAGQAIHSPGEACVRSDEPLACEVVDLAAVLLRHGLGLPSVAAGGRGLIGNGKPMEG